jgi:hypothetical protein
MRLERALQSSDTEGDAGGKRPFLTTKNSIVAMLSDGSEPISMGNCKTVAGAKRFRGIDHQKREATNARAYLRKIQEKQGKAIMIVSLKPGRRKKKTRKWKGKGIAMDKQNGERCNSCLP